ncbi:MAG: hypothetical protein WCO47_10930 [Methylococcus sp.]
MAFVILRMPGAGKTTEMRDALAFGGEPSGGNVMGRVVDRRISRLIKEPIAHSLFGGERWVHR